MTKAIFLDRDGVINQERKDYVKKLDEFNILENTSDAINIIKSHGFLVIIITNQSAINRRLLSVKTLNKIHEKLQMYLKKYNTSFDGIYFCPHTPYENCECRKPKPGLILQAVNDLCQTAGYIVIDNLVLIDLQYIPRVDNFDLEVKSLIQYE